MSKFMTEDFLLNTETARVLYHEHAEQMPIIDYHCHIPASDFRSFLSYTRHEYFRRILCRILGQWVEDGEYPADMETLGELVEDICCNNVRAYFGL